MSVAARGRVVLGVLPFLAGDATKLCLALPAASRLWSRTLGLA